MMKLMFLLFPMLFFYFVDTIPHEYRLYAKSWKACYICNDDGSLKIEQADVDAIKYLVECSWRRSQLTLEAQQQIWRSVTVMWKGWQNFAQTRLNPSRERPYLIDEEEKRCADFWDILQTHEDVCNEYGKVVKNIVYSDVLKSDVSKEAVNDIRQKARLYMLDALADVKQQLALLYDIAFKKGEHDLNQVKGSTISSFLMSYIPNLVINKFIEADAYYNTLTQDGWTVLEKIQMIGNQAWYAIETSRSQFYRALLDELATIP